ncbi:hypothetical protein QE152_g13571 [Popillia japonica]|uniref:Uncharacterized protein n=1 Tax=Popillia japonica TaxID=7064 RepID=A0AAW1LBD2_POPJA
MSPSYKTTALLVIVIFITLHLVEVLSKPTDGYKQTRIQCGNQDRIYLCQKCAKITKANNVYPNCCNESDDDVYNWCEAYIYYGHHALPPQS